MAKPYIDDVAPNDKTEISLPDSELDDPWYVKELPSSGKPWSEMTCSQRVASIISGIGKIILLIGLLYLFICSLSLLTSGFRLVGGKAASDAFTNNKILSNPVSNMMIGILVTVLVQSSSTSTSIVVSMVAADILTVYPAIFIVMGANIGTSVTNTIVSLGQVGNRNELRRAFGGATVHDMFNWLSVLCLLPIEWLSGSFGSWKGCGLLCQMTGAMVSSLKLDGPVAHKQDLLKALTNPLTNLIIQLDSKLLNKIAQGDVLSDDVTLIKHTCKQRQMVPSAVLNATGNGCKLVYSEQEVKTKCIFMFEYIANEWSDTIVGIVLLITALFVLCTCLVLIVRLLHSMLAGNIARIIKRFVNSDIPGRLSFLTGYIAILIGAGLTILVQSSSIFTSALTPLVGIGVLELERMYPLTLGSNIGTTATAIIASLASGRDKLSITLQVALCHLFFNVFGILIWYPIPFMRKVPITLAKWLGNRTAKYRWFVLVYLIFMFFVLPAIVFGLSLAGWEVLLGIGGPLFLMFVFIVAVNVLQVKRPSVLPVKLHNWDFLPKFMHSLQPYDRVMSALLCSKCCRKVNADDESLSSTSSMNCTEEESADKINGIHNVYDNPVATNEPVEHKF